MALTYAQRITDPRWIEAGNLFDAQLAQAPWWRRLNPHALSCIRYAVQEASLGEGSVFPDPDDHLLRELLRYVKMNEFGRNLLDQCRLVARNAARRRQEPA